MPFCLEHVYSFGAPEVCIAALEVGDGYLCLEFMVGLGHYTVTAVKKAQIGGLQYRLADASGFSLSDVKQKALVRGATLEAIQLIGALVPLTKDEELNMAEANTKLSRKTADKAGLKDAAKKAPVAGKAEKKGAKAPKGNAEALAKAREARAAKADAGPDKRKITVNVKENPFRDGSSRAENFNRMKRSKTVQDYLDNGGAAKYVKKFADMGHVTIA